MSLALKVQTPQQRCSDTPVPDRDVRILRNNNKVQFFVKKKQCWVLNSVEIMGGGGGVNASR